MNTILKIAALPQLPGTLSLRQRHLTLFLLALTIIALECLAFSLAGDVDLFLLLGAVISNSLVVVGLLNFQVENQSHIEP